MNYQKYRTIEKKVGETPLIAVEKMRDEMRMPKNIPLAYAGRLDPMASGKLLILIGEECKRQKEYHSLDKEYCVEILLGVSSDTGDVLGLITLGNASKCTSSTAIRTLKAFRGDIELPYPKFSSKTVNGKPLFMWTLENRLDEITIPAKKSRIHSISLHSLTTISKSTIFETVKKKIESIPKVAEASKALGADFRRVEVQRSWDIFELEGFDEYQILSFTCIASSGTYMRTLCKQIAQKLGTRGLAYSIHRTRIGKYTPLLPNFGFWSRKF